ncbi:MAG: LytR C-terminal domain-containing protein [Jatrophihabitans sp.]
MAHAAPTPPGGQRRNRVVGTLLVLLGVAVLVVAVISLGHPHGRRSTDATRTVTQSASSTPVSSTPVSSTPKSSPSTKKSTSSSSQSTKSSAPAKARASVYILNNTNRQGLAATVAAALKAQGWTVLATENYSNDIVSSTAYYDPSRSANRAAAEELQKEFPGIKRVVERFAQLPDAPIVLILNDDYP